MAVDAAEALVDVAHALLEALTDAARLAPPSRLWNPTDQLSAAGALAALPTATGIKFFTESPYDCAKPTWPGTTACGSEVLFSTVLPGGKLRILEFASVDVSTGVNRRRPCGRERRGEQAASVRA